MKIGRIIFTITILALATVSAFSLMMYINFSRLLDIPKEILQSGSFELSDKTYEFIFTTPEEARYSIVLNFIKEREKDPTTKYMGAHTIISELRDMDNNLLMSNSVDQNSRIHRRLSNTEFKQCFLSFNAKKKQTFKLKITFHSNDELLNKISKEIYVEKDYDPASKPWWNLFQTASLLVFGLTVLLIGIIIYLMRKKRRVHLFVLTMAFVIGPFLITIPVLAGVVETIQVLKISPQDGWAVIKTPDGDMWIIKVGDMIRDHQSAGQKNNGATVIEITSGRVVFEEMTATGKETVIVRLEDGKQRTERIRKSPDNQPVIFKPN
ncbi:MAG: hypothetical protein HZB33_09020 [Nitrospirae bacterium]|nr:hypothetical protein [Nitrospirota bacterium]